MMFEMINKTIDDIVNKSEVRKVIPIRLYAEIYEDYINKGKRFGGVCWGAAFCYSLTILNFYEKNPI